ncbi:microtubule organization protein AKNA isoform X2 [Macrotis lagotis]|uniref:microtubule organization protein AKNA isoform X2 n=1 Tax=Macrotis lagotis TaxID=92651 RepID=UPI003D6904CF
MITLLLWTVYFYDENELEDLEHQRNSTSSLYGSPQQDHWQDMAEDGLHGANRDFLELQRTQGPSNNFPQHVYKHQFSSDLSISPTSLGEAQGDLEGSLYGHEEDRLSGQSDISLYSTNAPTGHNLRPGSVGSTGSMPESIGQFGNSSEYPSESEAVSSLSDDHPRITPDESSQIHFPSPFSPVGLQHTPSANGKMNSDASYEERPVNLETVHKTGSATSQNSSNSKTQMPHSPGYKFGREEANSPFQWGETQPLDQIQKSKKASIVALRSQCSGSFCSFSPSKRSTPKRLNQSRIPKQGVNTPAHSSSEVSKYGRGQLNYPLPDFSKVEPKVRFPKDEESYRPPKGKSHLRQFQGSMRPLIFKSPAEIVQEVLLSNRDSSPQNTSLPSYTVARVPKEFKTPQQATELVQQLQEDYHKLLTKYAEAENTIDQLRLGAKVNLYSDPPKPSHGVHMGIMPHGTKVMSFTIPQARMAEWQSTSNTTSQALLNPELAATQGDLIPSPVAANPDPPTDGNGTSTLGPPLGDRLTQTLANEVVKFLAQVESFEGLVQEGRLVPQDQLKEFWRLKEEQDALEKTYLWARGEHRRMQQLQEPEVPPGEFDPNREVEGEIFRLGMRLEELMDEVDDLRPDQHSLRMPPEEKSHGSSAASPVLDPLILSPDPSTQAPMPTIRTPYPEISAIQNEDTFLGGMNTEVSSASSELEDESPGLPKSLRYKQLQMEEDFQSLVAQCHSIKSLPVTVKLEEDQEEKNSTQEEKNSTEEVDGPVAGNPNAFEARSRRTEQEEGKYPNCLEVSVEQRQSTQPLELLSSLRNGGHYLGGLLQSPIAQSNPPASKLALPVTEQKQPSSHQSSTTSLAGSNVSGSLPLQKSFHLASSPQLARNLDVNQDKEHRIVSPETDSGFVGSETSRVSPLTQTPDHRLSHTSTSDPRRLPQSSTVCLPQAPSSHYPGRDQFVRVSSGFNKSETQVQRSDPMPNTFPRKWTKSYQHKPGPGERMAALEEDGQSPAPNPSDEVPQETARDSLSNLISREVRDQAIRALQQEVTRLRERIEASLDNPARDISSHNFQLGTRARSRLAKDLFALGNSSHTSKSAERYRGDHGDTTQSNSRVRLRLRSSSVPREGPQPAQTSKSEQFISRVQSKESRAEEQNLPDRIKGETRGKQTDEISYQGHYTGQEYYIKSSQRFQADNNSRSCPYCHSVRKNLPDNTPSKDPEELFPHDYVKKSQCPMCHRPRSPEEKDREPSGIDKGTQKGSPPSSGPIGKSGQRQQQSTSPSLPRPLGLWYLAPPLPGPVGAAFTYVPPVPVVPYSPPALYYSPVAPTSTSSSLHYSSGKKPAQMRPSSQSRQTPTPGRRYLSELDLIDLDDLSRSLSQAVEAAKNVELTTKQMSRSLSADLHRARGLRGSCLF